MRVTKDPKEALMWYRKAADQGDAQAEFNVGAMYASGAGVEPDQSEAFKWYQKSAEHGFAMAQHNLGIRYRYWTKRFSKLY